jgi:nitrous oxidase accessory protein NosD
MTSNTTSLSSGESVAAVFLAKNADDVDIEGLIIDGTNNGITECSPRLIGILYQDASGWVKHNAVRRMNLPASLNGCQSGDGIEVQSSTGGTSKVIIEDNSVHDYQKNGITGNELGTDVSIERNTVTGIGSTSGAAQNGIQLGFGAKGSVTENNVTGNVWAPCVSVQECEFSATGILVFQSDDVKVSENSVGTNQVGIFIGGQNSEVDHNNVFDSVVLVGIALAGNNNKARYNHVKQSGQAALLIQGNGNRVRDNTITEAPVGILKVSGSTGNAFSENLFFATPVPFQDPAPQKHTQVSPVR